MKRALWGILTFILLGAVWWLWQQPVSQSQDMDAWPHITAQDIVKITIQKQGDKNIILNLQQKKWRLDGGDLAVQDAVWRLLDDLAAMQVIRVVTRKHNHDADLGLLDRGVSVQCMDAQGSVLLDMRVGKQGSDLLSSYVRLVGSDAVVAVNRALVWQVKRSRKSWKAVAKDAS